MEANYVKKIYYFIFKQKGKLFYVNKNYFELITMDM